MKEVPEIDVHYVDFRDLILQDWVRTRFRLPVGLLPTQFLLRQAGDEKASF